MAQDETVHAFIEIPAGSTNKYEYDADLGVFRLSRVLFPSVHYPVNYGMLPGTRGGDGDRLDIMVLSEEPILRGTLLSVRPVAMLRMSDEKGPDTKILAVPEDDPHYDAVKECGDLPSNRLKEIELFFRLYKLPDEEHEVHLNGWASSQEARDLISRHTIMPAEKDTIFRSEGRRC